MHESCCFKCLAPIDVKPLVGVPILASPKLPFTWAGKWRSAVSDAKKGSIGSPGVGISARLRAILMLNLSLIDSSRW